MEKTCRLRSFHPGSSIRQPCVSVLIPDLTTTCFPVPRDLHSKLYECRVFHARLEPRPHRFEYRIFLFALDLSELARLDRQLTLFSVEKPNLYRFSAGDYLPVNARAHNATRPGQDHGSANPANTSLLDAIAALLRSHGHATRPSRVVLVTLPRVSGYLFNPVSFYFCYGVEGRLEAVIPEVTNTFREMKPYVLGPDTRQPDGTFVLRIPKHFYVSPFSDVDVAFEFRIADLGDNLRIQIDDYTGGRRTLTSTLAGTARPLNDANLAWFSLKYPLITLKIIGLIHWHALRLYLKRVPWFAKAARPGDQRDLYRPHASLLQPTSPDA